MKYIFFDLDGTLVDSSEGIETTFLHTFNLLEVPASHLLQRKRPTANLPLPRYQRTPSSIKGIGFPLIHHHL